MNGRVGMVLAGAGARGAYEAGAISVLLPELERRGERPTVLIGTSAGAINAAFLASRAQAPAAEAAEELCSLWTSLHRSDVFGLAGITYRATLLRGRRGILSTDRLRRTLRRHLGSPDRIRHAVETGDLDALGVVTTSSANGRVSVFMQGGPVPDADQRRGIDYVVPDEGVGVRHVLASAAIPALFPPVLIDGAWHVDGGMRLNTPIKPAKEMGVDRVVIVATDPAHHPKGGAGYGPVPDFDDDALLFIQALLAAPLADDMWRLGGINELLGRSQQRAGKRPIDFMFVVPSARGELGRLAHEVVKTRPWWEHLVLKLLAGKQGPQGRELLTYLLFEPAFLREAVEMGKRDARWELDMLKAMETPWRRKRPVAAER